MIPPIVIKILGRDTLAPKLTQVQRQLRQFGKTAKRIGKSMTRSLTLPIVASGALIVKASTDFNAAMANVGTLIPGNLKRLNELKKGVQDLSIETGKSTAELAEGLFQVISALGDSAETFDRLRVNARGSVAGISTVAEAVSLTTLVTKNYGDVSAKATQKVLDLAFKANELGKTTFPEMAQAMGAVIPFAKNLGVSQEELFGVMGTFTGVAGNTSEVVTQLRSLLGALLKPTADMTKAYKVLGLQSGKEMINTLGLQGAMMALMRITKAYPGVLGKVLGRKEALNLQLAATGPLTAIFTEKTKKMSDVVGTAEKAFKAQTQGINKTGFAMKQLWRRVVVLAQNFGDELSPAIEKVIKKLTPLVKWITNLSPKTKMFIIVIAGVVAALGPLIVAVATLGLTLQTVGWPITLIIGGVILLGLAIAGLIIWWDKIIDTVARFGWILAIVSGPIGLFIWAGALLIKHWEPVKQLFSDIYHWIKKMLDALAMGDLSKVLTLLNIAGGSEADKQLAQRAQEDVGSMYMGIGAPLTGTIDLNVKAPAGTDITTSSEGGDINVINRGPAFALDNG